MQAHIHYIYGTNYENVISPILCIDRRTIAISLALLIALRIRATHVGRPHPTVVAIRASDRLRLISAQHRRIIAERHPIVRTVTRRRLAFGGSRRPRGGGHHAADSTPTLALVERREIVRVAVTAGVVEETARIQREVVEVAQMRLIAGAVVERLYARTDASILCQRSTSTTGWDIS